jgi:hypothetical protein
MAPMPSLASRPKLRRVLIAVTALLILVGAFAAFVILHSPGNVSHPNLSFTSPSTPPVPPRRPKKVQNFVWAVYGYDNARTHYLAAPHSLSPPFRVGWRFQDMALLEFPPVIYGNGLFVLDDDGSARAIDKRTGRVIWHRKIGTLAAASPGIAVRQRLVVMVLLSTSGRHPGNGRVAALSLTTGRVVWSHPLPAGSESSPLADGNSVYFGDQSGTVYGLNMRNGHVRWTYHASAAVKGGISLSHGILYFGDYAGRAYALHASTGTQLWAVGTSGTRFGFGSGNFYSTPAVAFGRVYMGNTDGNVYSFAARTGQLAWSTGTGSYVYASPAVADIKGLGPTVYIGSYDGKLYAFDARSGAVRWAHPAGGKISGAATIVGNVVYYSDLGHRITTGLNAVTGRVLFNFPDGAFNPVIADYGALYMSGYTQLYQLLPITRRRPTHARRSQQMHAANRHLARPRHRKR